MRTKIQITNDANLLKDTITASINKLIDVSKSDVSAITSASSVADAAAKASELIERVNTIFSVYNDNLVSLPAHIYRFTYGADSINPITLTVRSKLKANVKYVKTVTVPVDANFVENVAHVFYDGLFEMYYLEEAYKNVADLNGMLSDLCEENKIPYKFGFAVNASSSSIVESITNDTVIFNASVASAIDITDFGICQSGSEYADFVHEEAVTKLIESLKAIQTTVQLVKGNVEIIKKLTGVSTKKHASKIIRGAYHKNSRFISKQKSGVAYYNETVDINGEEVNVFALVEKAEDGSISVVLNPFDTKTLFNVDFDVIKAIKEFA